MENKSKKENYNFKVSRDNKNFQSFEQMRKSEGYTTTSAAIHEAMAQFIRTNGFRQGNSPAA